MLTNVTAFKLDLTWIQATEFEVVLLWLRFRLQIEIPNVFTRGHSCLDVFTDLRDVAHAARTNRFPADFATSWMNLWAKSCKMAPIFKRVSARFSPIPPQAGRRQGRRSYFKNCRKGEGVLRMWSWDPPHPGSLSAGWWLYGLQSALMTPYKSN